MWRNFWNDEQGAIITAELVLILTILVIAMVVGLSAVRDSVVTELADVGQAISNADQSFAVARIQGPSSSVAGFGFSDQVDFCDSIGANGPNSRCIVVAGAGPVDGADGGLATTTP